MIEDVAKLHGDEIASCCGLFTTLLAMTNVIEYQILAYDVIISLSKHWREGQTVAYIEQIASRSGQPTTL